MKERIAIEDALKHFHEWEYQGRSASAESLAGATGTELAVATELVGLLLSKGLVRTEAGKYHLEPDGERYARRMLRAHRLLETAMATEGIADSAWHGLAEKGEHALSDEDIERLSAQLGHPRWDPHGDPIPTADGYLPEIRGIGLADLAKGWEGRVTHVEDEPEEVYARLTEQGIVAGSRFRIETIRGDGIELRLVGRTVFLDHAMVVQLRAVPLPADDPFDDSLIRLSDLDRSARGRIRHLGPECRGPERRRLLDLGLVPGTIVSIDLTSPSGNPVAYGIRGASIALRTEQTDKVFVVPVEEVRE